MNQISTFSTQAELALAAYGNYQNGLRPDASELSRIGMSSVQAADFRQRWIVVEQYDDLNGLSATVFQDQSGKRYLAIRGTDPSLLDLTADFILANGFPAQLNPQFVSLKAKILDWTSKGVLPLSFTVAGHSLGGYLADAVGLEFGNRIEAIYTYNAPGVNGASAVLDLLRSALGITGASTLSNLTNLRATAGFSPIANLGRQLASPTLIDTEISLNPLNNHSIVPLTDSLALYDLFAKLDPALNTIDPAVGISKITDILKTASATPARSLEAALDSLRKLFRDPAAQGFAATITDDREAFYQNLYNADFQSRVTANSGLVSITSLVDKEALAIEANAFADIAYRYALKELNPFAVVGNNDLFTPYNTGVNAGALDLYNPTTRTGGLTTEWINDRAAFLVWKNQYFTADGQIVLRRDGDENQLFENRDNAAKTDLSLTVVGNLAAGGNSGAAANPAKVVFGNTATDVITGGILSDRLYGDAGTDWLEGRASADYLEGGQGLDVYNYGAFGGLLASGNDGTDTIRDTDSKGVIRYTFTQGGLLSNTALSTVIVEASVKLNNTQWQSADGRFTYTKTPNGQGRTDVLITINGDAGGSLTLKDFRDGDFGIWLREPIPSPTQVIAGDQDSNFPDDFLAGVPDINAGFQWKGLAGNDVVNPISLGNDLIEGNAGSDILAGSNGRDEVFGGDAVSLATFITESRTAAGTGSRGDWVSGGLGDDLVAGSHGNDVLMGGGGVDLLVGGGGDDVIDGDDNFLPSTNPVPINGGEIPERFYTAPKFDWVVDRADPLSPSFSFINIFSTAREVGAGDVVYAGAGNDFVAGLFGDDAIFGEAGDDVIRGDDGSDILVGGDGNDRLAGESAGKLAGDGLQPVPGDDYLDGGAGNDELLGEEGTDILIGGAGNDTLVGGPGKDIYIFNKGDGADDIVDIPAGANDPEASVLVLGEGISRSDIKFRLGSLRVDFGPADPADPNSPRDQIHFEGFDPDDPLSTPVLGEIRFADGSSMTYQEVLDQGFDLDGSESDDLITGTAVADRIRGFGGNDVLLGSAGDDGMEGGTGDDRLEGAEGEDTLIGGENNDLLLGGAENDVLSGEAGEDTLEGGEGDDMLAGAAGADLLNGGTGNDVLAGGDGLDSYALSFGMGRDTALDTGGRILLQTGLDFNALRGVRAGDDLALTIRGTEDGLLFKDYYLAPQDWTIEEADGTQTMPEAIVEATAEREQNVLDALREDYRYAYKARIYDTYLFPGSPYRLLGDGIFQSSWQTLPGAELVATDASWNQQVQTTTISLFNGSTSTTTTTSGSGFWDTGDALLFVNMARVVPSTLESDEAFIFVEGRTERTEARPVVAAVTWDGGLQDFGTTFETSTTRLLFGTERDPNTGELIAIGTATTTNVSYAFDGVVTGRVTGIDPNVSAQGGLFPEFINETLVMNDVGEPITEVIAGPGDNEIFGGALVDAGAGNDAVFDAGFAYGGEGDDLLEGGEILIGGPGDDQLYNGGVLAGGPGNNTLDGGSGATRYLIDPAEPGFDRLQDSGDSQDAFLDSFYASLGIFDWRDRQGVETTQYVITEGPIFNTLEEAEAYLADFGFNSFAEAVEGGVARLIEPLPPAPQIAANDFAALTPYYESGVIEADAVEFGQGITAGDLSLSWDEVPLTSPVSGALEAYTTLDVSWGPASVAKIAIPHAEDPLGVGVEQFRFANGSVLTMQEMVAAAPPAPSFDPQDQDNVLEGSARDEVILARAGNDTVSGGGGNDYIEGGAGTDILRGGEGADGLADGQGNNFLDGGPGDDNLQADGAPNFPDGGSSMVVGGPGDDWIGSYAAGNVIAFNSGDGRDTIYAANALVLSLGGGIDPAALSLSQDGSDLLLSIGANDSIRLTRQFEPDPQAWPQITLQMFGSVHLYDFNAVIAEFQAALAADPSLGQFPLDSVLPAHETSVSETEAFGGALAYQYGTAGNVNALSDAAIRPVLTDAKFGTAPQSIAVAGGNQAPSLGTPLVDQTAPEDSAFGIPLPAGTFVDADAGDTLTFSAVLVDGSPLPGWLSFNTATQGFSGTPTNDDVGALDITVTATDSGGLSVSDTFTLTVANVNDAPVAGEDAGAVTEDGGPVVFGGAALLANDTDVDAGDTLSIVSVTDSAAGAQVTLLGGEVVYDAGGLFQSLGSGAAATDSFAYTVADAAGATAVGAVTLTITGVNDAPALASALLDQAGNQNALFQFVVPEATFSDVDTGDALSFSATLADGAPLPAWLAFDPLSLSFSGTPSEFDVGGMEIRLTATDGVGAAASGTFALAVSDASTLSETHTGTPHRDEIVTGFANDLIDAGRGDDLVRAGAGRDTVLGGGGHDRLEGEAGNDVLAGEEGHDYLGGGLGNDVLAGGEGHDRLEGDAGDDLYFYERHGGHDVIEETGGADTLLLGAGIAPEAVRLERSRDDLVVDFEGREGSVTVKGWFAAEAKQVETIRFADGTAWDVQSIRERTRQTSGDPDGGPDQGRHDDRDDDPGGGVRKHDEERRSRGRDSGDGRDELSELLEAYLAETPRYDFEELDRAGRREEALSAPEIVRRWERVNRYAYGLSNEQDEDARQGAGSLSSVAEGLLGGREFGSGFGHSGSTGAMRGVGNLQTLQGLAEGFRRIRLG